MQNSGEKASILIITLDFTNSAMLQANSHTLINSLNIDSSIQMIISPANSRTFQNIVCRLEEFFCKRAQSSSVCWRV